MTTRERAAEAELPAPLRGGQALGLPPLVEDEGLPTIAARVAVNTDWDTIGTPGANFFANNLILMARHGR
jgi:hypothetical protein